MIKKEEKTQLLELHAAYSKIHSKFTELGKETSRLEMNRIKLSQELENTRKLEKELINKIEQRTGGKIGQSELLKIIQEDGDQGQVL